MSRRLALGLIVLASLSAHAKGLFSPPLDYHYHRQVNVAAIARNYHEDGLKFLEPRIDWDGPAQGRAATEFPLYMWLIGLFWPLFGLGEVWGRLLSAGFSAATAVYLFKIVEEDMSQKPAFWAAVVFSFIPLEIYFGRTLQPEAAALLGSTAALFHFRRSLRQDARVWDWPLAVLGAFLAISLKLPYGFILIPLAYLAWQSKGKGAFTDLKVLAAPLVALAGVYLWYRYASAGSYVVPTKGSEFTSLLDYDRLPYFILFQFTSRLPELALTYTGAALAAFGLTALCKKNPFYAVWWGAVAASLICGGGYTFHHEYTSLPFAPINAAFIGAGAALLLEKRRVLAALLILGMPVHAALRIKHWYNQNYAVLAGAAKAADKVSAPGDLFIANERAGSVYLFYLKRRGWSWDIAESGQAKLPEVDARIALGAKYFVTQKAGVFADKESLYVKWFARFPVVYDEDGLLVYKLKAR